MSFEGLAGTSAQIFPRLHWANGTSKIIGNPYAIDWYPGNTSVATISEAWDNFRVQFQDVGDTLIDAQVPNECHYVYDLGQCVCQYPVPVWAQQLAQARTRRPKWVAATSTSTSGTPLCPQYLLRSRIYQALDDFGFIPFALNWQLNETLTYRYPTCGQPVLGGSVNEQTYFEDLMSIGCSNPVDCFFEVDQTFSVAQPLQPLQQLPAKTCLGMSAAQCLSQPTHRGWHARIASDSIIVTPQ